jgi:hypothetical protein
MCKEVLEPPDAPLQSVAEITRRIIPNGGKLRFALPEEVFNEGLLILVCLGAKEPFGRVKLGSLLLHGTPAHRWA